MPDLFFLDKISGVEKTYDDLISDINSVSEQNYYIKSENYYEIFKLIVSSLVRDTRICVLDGDLSDTEITQLVEDHPVPLGGKKINKSVNSVEELIERIKSPLNWDLTLFTSGTTGKPKQVTHSLPTLIRQVKEGTQFRNNVWGFAYNPAHIAGIQVFFQALLNRNAIIRLFECPPDKIPSIINEYKITHISATPTFYRLLPNAGHVCNSVLKLSSGGERFDPATMKKLNVLFPAAKVLNIYASTEAGTILASDGDLFVVKEKDAQFVKISDNELLIHKSLLGAIEKSLLRDEWFPTGDLVEIVSEIPLKFRIIARKTEMINMAGYKVNPGEIESAISEIPGVRQVRVFGKKNSVVGNIICAEIVTVEDNLDEKTIRHALSDKLQNFKIPRVIKFVDTIESTATGKLKRN